MVAQWLVSYFYRTKFYLGFHHVLYAAYLCAREPERLRLVTKWLYPNVAVQYNTNWQAVERNIRTVIATAWRRKPELLAQRGPAQPMLRTSTPSRFLCIPVEHMSI